jgi:hypothetical protein
MSRDEVLLVLRQPVGVDAVDDEWARTRPAPDVWSPLEYVAHTRDGVAWYRERIELVLSEDHPQLTALDWDSVTAERDYRNRENLVSAVDGWQGVASALADRLAELTPEQWQRTGRGSGGGDRTVLVLAARAAHECAHHRMDIARIGQAGRTLTES